MAALVPETPSEKCCKGGLNCGANPSERLTDGDQLILGSTEEKCRQGAQALAQLGRDAMRDNGFSLSTLGSMIGKDATAAHRVLDVDDPSTALRILAALLILDKAGTWIGGTARLTGRRAVNQPRLTPEQKLARLEEALRRHGKAGEALLAEAYGEGEP